MHVVCNIVTIQLGQIRHLPEGCVIVQTVGEMIRCQNDHGIIRDSGLLQIIHQIGQRILQLQVRCDISLDRIGVRQILYLRPVLVGHGIYILTVDGMSTDGHVIYVERLLVDVLGQCTLDHLHITFRPASGDILLSTVSDTLESVAVPQIDMCHLPAVVRIIVVVVALPIVTQPVQLAADGEVVVVIRSLLHGLTAHGRKHTHDILVLTAGGTCRRLLIIVGEIDSLCGQPVQRRRQLRIDDISTEGLCRQEDQVLPLEETGVIILHRCIQRSHILIQLCVGSLILLCKFGEGNGITVRHVGLLLFRRCNLGGLCTAAGSLCRISSSRLRFTRGAVIHLCNIEASLLIRICHLPPDFLPKTGHETKVSYCGFEIVLIGIYLTVRLDAHDQDQCDQVAGDGYDTHLDLTAPSGLQGKQMLLIDLQLEDDKCNCGQKIQDDMGDPLEGCDQTEDIRLKASRCICCTMKDRVQVIEYLKLQIYEIFYQERDHRQEDHDRLYDHIYLPAP